MDLIILAFLVSIGINIIMFVPAFIFKTDKLTDISYSITFAVLAVFGYTQSTQTYLHKIILILILLWAVRLGLFLFVRINKIGKDVRFDKMRNNFLLFLRFWLLQGSTVFVVMLTPILGFVQKNPTIGLLSWVGIIVFMSGLIIESIADVQKIKFNSNTKNKGKWINVGIWRASRHPNYLGEMMVWVGMYLIVVASLPIIEQLVALLSPLFIIVLLLFVSGIPLLEKSAQKKWGNKKEFIKYKSEVPVLIPNVRSIKRTIN